MHVDSTSYLKPIPVPQYDRDLEGGCITGEEKRENITPPSTEPVARCHYFTD